MAKIKKLNIVILSTSFPRFEGDYIAHFFLEIASRFAKKHNVSVVCPHNKDIRQFEVINKVKIKRFKYMPSKLEILAYGDGMAINFKKNIWIKLMIIPFLISFLFKSINEVKRSDIIIANFIPSALVGLCLKRVYKKPVILTIHRVIEINGLIGKINKYIIKNVDAVIFNSSYTQKKLLKFTKPKYQEVIFVGIENDRFSQSEKSYNGKRKLKILSIGRLIEKKGYVYLINAINRIEKTHPNKLELNIIGWGSLKESLNRQIKNLGLKNVNLLGGKNPKEIPHYLNDADLFVLPSIIDSEGETETLGVVFMEAMASGLPVIGSNVGGIIDVIDNPDFLIEPKNTKDLANIIIKFIDEPNLIEINSKLVIKRARDVFDWKLIVNQYLCVINKLKKKKRLKMKHQYNYSMIDEYHRKEMFNQNKRITKAKRILKVLEDFSKDNVNKLNCLDIGCSTGFTISVLAERFKEVVGLDIDEDAINFAQNNNSGENIKFVLANGLSYPFSDKSFDVIICNQIYEHVPNPDKLVSEISRLLKDDGFCYFGACNKYFPFEPHYRLLLLSYFPKKIANLYLRLFKGQKEYYENLYSYRRIKKLLNDFEIKDYTLKIIKNHKKFNLKINGFIPKVPSFIFKLFYPIFPSYIFIIYKKENKDVID